MAAGVAVALPGLVIAPVRWRYDYAWFVGFLAAGAAHLALWRRAVPWRSTKKRPDCIHQVRLNPISIRRRWLPEEVDDLDH